MHQDRHQEWKWDDDDILEWLHHTTVLLVAMNSVPMFVSSVHSSFPPLFHPFVAVAVGR